ncbi:MAG: hypothetical protein D6755_09380 [Anaerolineae bacterium]|nr:MAG: hypothetical protein D6755_09380 [Anaerolineae bacterium]
MRTPQSSNPHFVQHISITAITLMTLYPAMLAGAFVGYQILFLGQRPPLNEFTAELITIGLGFMAGVGCLSYGIDRLHIPYLPFLARVGAVLTISGGVIIQAKMISKLLLENYTFGKFVLHLTLLLLSCFVVALLDHVHPRPMRAQYAIPILILEVIHLNIMVIHYVLIGAKSPATVLGDLTLFTTIITLALAFLGQSRRVVNLLAYKLTKTLVEM